MPPRAKSDPSASDAAAARAAGRPLDENVDAAILAATWHLLLRDGYSRMSIAGIADEAGVGRPAIYRRYRDKAELVAAVIEDKRSSIQPIDTGSARDDLVAYLEFSRRRFTIKLAGTLIVEQQEHPELLEVFRRGMMGPRNEEMAAALDRGKARGEVREDLDTLIASHALMGSFLAHSLAVGQPKPGWAERVVDTLWPAFAAPAR